MLDQQNSKLTNTTLSYMYEAMSIEQLMEKARFCSIIVDHSSLLSYIRFQLMQLGNINVGDFNLSEA